MAILLLNIKFKQFRYPLILGTLLTSVFTMRLFHGKIRRNYNQKWAKFIRKSWKIQGTARKKAYISYVSVPFQCTTFQTVR